MSFIGRVIRGIVKIVTSIFKGLSKEIKQLVPIAIAIGDAVKLAIDNPISGSLIQFLLDAVKTAIPGKFDDAIIDAAFAKLKANLGKILIDLRLVESIAETDDPEEMLKLILAQFKFSSDTQYNLFIHDFVILVTEAVADGELTWTEILSIQEVLYKHPEILE